MLKIRSIKIDQIINDKPINDNQLSGSNVKVKYSIYDIGRIVEG